MQKELTLETLSKNLEKLYGKKDRYQVLKDFFKVAAIALNNGSTLIHDKAWEYLENEYKNVMKTYEPDGQKIIVDSFATLVDVMDQDIQKGIFKDWLGELYMKSCTASKEKAQHFTPYSVGKMMAEMTLKQDIEKLKQKEVITFNDPCVGGGCLPIAYCDVLKENNINYQQKALIVCNDNDERCFYMAYIQLSLIGCPARVELKDTLLNKNLGMTWDTPALKVQHLKFSKYLD